ncbi:hypothetical protein BV898_02930 [Hypsibius exemplaris]|uniref:Transcription factor IIIC subunit 5 HTH domain-containing protein n=1 Tax=Hypsibius exemplaris TaxID=2072580 RepID=A0A1W0X6Q3_HYPEX|nr:hypothetical protein BV898_02930 [Hypsibius exemplaris]
MPRKRKVRIADAPQIADAAENAASAAPTESPTTQSVRVFPAFETLDWKPVGGLRGGLPAGKSGVSILLPFSDVEPEDAPDLLEHFGGVTKVIAAVKHPNDQSKALAFDVSRRRDSSTKIIGIQPNQLSTKSVTNSFLLVLTLTPRTESPEAQDARAKMELTAVQRALGTPLPPLPPVVTDMTFRYPIRTVFEFDRLFDFGMSPAIVEDRTSVNPAYVNLKSIVPYLVPSFPPRPLPEGCNTNDYIYFPALKFASQPRTGAHDCIPSLYTDSLSAHEKTVVRTRKTHACSAKWTNTTSFVPPKKPTVAAEENLKAKVPAEIIQRAKKLFQEQPIWMRTAFYGELCKQPGLLKEHRRFVLPGVAYKCSNGPWSHAWARFGYNPTKDVKARQFQVLDYRINQALFRPKQTVMKKQKQTPRDLIVKTIVNKILQNNKGQTPAHARGFQFIMQLTNMVDIPELMAVITSPERQTDSCDFVEGFFKAGTMERLRLEMSKAIFREDPALAPKNGWIVAKFQEFGMFRGVPVVSLPEGDGDSEEEEDDGEPKTGPEEESARKLHGDSEDGDLTVEDIETLGLNELSDEEDTAMDAE